MMSTEKASTYLEERVESFPPKEELFGFWKDCDGDEVRINDDMDCRIDEAEECRVAT